ncbi:hypothetical protein LguiA_028065 [Lonicera macranthoides]
MHKKGTKYLGQLKQLSQYIQDIFLIQTKPGNIIYNIIQIHFHSYYKLNLVEGCPLGQLKVLMLLLDKSIGFRVHGPFFMNFVLHILINFSDLLVLNKVNLLMSRTGLNFLIWTNRPTTFFFVSDLLVEEHLGVHISGYIREDTRRAFNDRHMFVVLMGGGFVPAVLVLVLVRIITSKHFRVLFCFVSSGGGSCKFIDKLLLLFF